MIRCVLCFAFFLGTVRLDCPPPDPTPVCFTQKEFDDAALLARDQLAIRESILLSSYDIPGFTVTKDEAAYHHFFNQKVEEDALLDNRIATFTNSALKYLMHTRNFTKSQLRLCLQNITTSAFCVPRAVSCDPATTNYYRLDGQCNNAKDPLLGAMSSPFIRVMEDGFIDGIDTPSPTQTVISSRSDSVIANEVKGRNEINIPEANNEMTTLAGQIMTHELMKTRKVQLTTDNRFGGFQCCNPNNDANLTKLIELNDYCMPISVPHDDPCFRGKVKCLNYIKSMKSLNNCKLDSTSMPNNFHTPYIDAELIYNEKTLEHLDANGGKFDIEHFHVLEELLVGYDERTMQLPGLFQFLKFFVRLHNTILTELKRVKDSSTPEKIKALTHLVRSITTALYQKTFLDMCINVLPPQQAILLNNLGSCYDPKLNPQCSLEFNIALRDFHYFIGEKFSVYDANLFKVPNGIRGLRPVAIPLPTIMDNLTFAEQNECGIVHGSMDFAWNIAGVGENVQCRFMPPNATAFGTDLRGFDYQMGVEHGQPSYLELLKKFHGFNKCDNEFTKNDFILHDKSTQDFFAKRYKNLRDVTLSLGADFEDKRGQIIGPTNSMLIAEQLKRSICGDRFWFMHAPFFTSTHKQRLTSIRFFDIVCLSVNCGGTRVQVEPFLSPGPGNLKRVCSTQQDILSILDLRSW